MFWIGGHVCRISCIVWWPRSWISLLPLTISFGRASSLKNRTPFPPVMNVCGWRLSPIIADCLVTCVQNSLGYSYEIQMINAQASFATYVRRSFIYLMSTGWRDQIMVETTWNFSLVRSSLDEMSYWLESLSESTRWPTCSRWLDIDSNFCLPTCESLVGLAASSLLEIKRAGKLSLT